MIIRSEVYRSEGFIREAVKYGFGDLRVLVENEEIRTFKSILYINNETFRKVLDDPLFEEPLKLCDECSKESFFLLEKYYQGIEIEITEKNCVDLLAICVCYNESSIMKRISDYVINHLNGNIIVDLLRKKEILRSENLKELKDELEYFLKNENYKLMKNELLNHLSIDNIAYLFSFGIKFNGNELELLRILSDYYRCSIHNLNEKEMMKRLIEKCSFNLKELSELNEKDKKVLSDLDISPNENENEKYVIRYYTIPEIENEYFFDFLIHYYPEEDVQIIDFKKSHLITLGKEEISSDIETLLNEGNIRIIVLMLQLHDALYRKIYGSDYLNYIGELLYIYKNTDSEEKRKLLLKYIKRIFGNIESIPITIYKTMKEKYGKEFVFNLLNDDGIIGENGYSALMSYMHEFRLDDAECRLLDSIIQDEDKKKEIKYHELKSISYSENENISKKMSSSYGYYYSYKKEYECNYFVGDNVELKPVIDNIVDVENVTIEPELPSGLLLDQNTGIISGIANECCNKNYKITVQNIHGKKSEDFHLIIKRKSDEPLDKHH